MRKYGGFIPGIRPGKRTADYINDILTRITLVGALYLIIISLIPEWMIAGIHLQPLAGMARRRLVRTAARLGDQRFGRELLLRRHFAADRGRRCDGYGNQIESQLIMRHYEGFTPRSGRIRGRRTW